MTANIHEFKNKRKKKNEASKKHYLKKFWRLLVPVFISTIKLVVLQFCFHVALVALFTILLSRLNFIAFGLPWGVDYFGKVELYR